jgi:hypothetical protein
VDHNPYKPPEANVTDRANGAPKMEMPKQVLLATRLMWLTLLVGLVAILLSGEPANTLSTIDANVRGTVLVFVAVILAISTLFLAWILQKVKAGRNWARIVLLVLTVLSIVNQMSSPGELIEIAPILFIAALVNMVLEIWSLVLLFRPPGADWFKPGARG